MKIIAAIIALAMAGCAAFPPSVKTVPGDSFHTMVSNEGKFNYVIDLGEGRYKYVWEWPLNGQSYKWAIVRLETEINEDNTVLMMELVVESMKYHYSAMGSGFR